MTLPQIRPMVLVRAREAFDHPDWIFEPKFDGFRALAYIEDGQCQLVSRRKHAYRSFDTLSKQLGHRLRVQNAILDGEIACLGEDGRPLFNELLYRRGEPVFCVFDVLYLNGKDLRTTALIDRKVVLQAILPKKGNAPILYVDHQDGEGVVLFKAACHFDLEGIVAKWKHGGYSENERETSWVKIKNPNYTQMVGRHEQFERFRRLQLRPARQSA